MSSVREDKLRDLDELLAAAAKLTKVFPDAVLVGGTAAAVYAAHRLSTDTDFVLPGMAERFKDTYETLDSSPAWELARTTPPVMIMGNFHGVETTLRKLIRNRPLETEKVEGPSGTVNVPTLDEMIRIKAWLALTRNAYRDYLDLAALSEVAGIDRVREVMSGFDDYYSDVDRKGVVRNVSPCLQLMRQLFEPKPHDLANTGELEHYKKVDARWSDPQAVLERCREIGFAIADDTFALDADIENDLETIDKAKLEKTVRPTMPPFPAETHEAHVSKDGCVIVIRMKAMAGRDNPKVDNPLGPAVVGPEGVRYALVGKFMTEGDWRAKLEDERRSQPGL